MIKVTLIFTTTESSKEIYEFLKSIKESKMLNSHDNETGIMLTFEDLYDGRLEMVEND